MQIWSALLIRRLPAIYLLEPGTAVFALPLFVCPSVGLVFFRLSLLWGSLLGLGNGAGSGDGAADRRYRSVASALDSLSYEDMVGQRSILMLRKWNWPTTV